MNLDTVKWAVAAKQKEGETISGDLLLVKQVDNGALVAVADGLGHGEPAAQAAALAMNTAEQWAYEPLARVLEHCHQKLHRTRGAVISLAFFNALDNTMTWLGVGNVEGLLMRSTPNGKHTDESLILSAGVVGIRLPRLRTAVLEVTPGDTLIFTTDGIRPGFQESVVLSQPLERIAQGILERDSLGTDDALVLVVSYRGRPQ